MSAAKRMLCFVAVFTLAGCGSGEHEDIKQWMTDASKDLKGSAPPLPELRPFPLAPYDAHDLPDPFKAERAEPEKKDTGGVNKPDFDRPREQLEAFPLDALQFSGVISTGAGSHALVRAGEALYQVGVGNYMGQNFGRIVAIGDTEVTIIETVQDPSGQTSAWVERQVSLQLPEGGAGQGGR